MKTLVLLLMAFCASARKIQNETDTSLEQDSGNDAGLTTNQIFHQQMENIIGSIIRLAFKWTEDLLEITSSNESRVEELKYISWEEAAQGVKTGNAGVMENFLAYHAVDEEGSYEVHEEVRHDPGPMSAMINGMTLLMVAAIENNINAAKTLLEAGANPNHKDEYGNAALHWLMRRNNTEILKLFMKHPGIDVNIRPHGGGSTPLMVLFMKPWVRDRLAVVKLFLEHPAIDINAETKWGSTALCWAKNGPHSLAYGPPRDCGPHYDDHFEILSLLEERGAVCRQPGTWTKNC